jgi:hypothetical protein
MSEDECAYAIKILKNTVKDSKKKRESIRRSLKNNYTDKKR